MKTQTVAQAIVVAVNSRKNCTSEWFIRWGDRIKQLEDLLPSGSGFDSGTSIVREHTNYNQIVLKTAFHHLNEHGYYTRWTHHGVVVTPDWEGLKINVKGRDFRQIKEYIFETMHDALNADAPEHIVGGFAYGK